MIDISTAISAGTIIIRLASSGLYQTRDSTRSGGASVRPWSRTRAEWRLTIASA